MIIYILGDSSFLAKNFYKYVKKHHNDIFLINYKDVCKLKNIKNDDVLINFCGVNRANNWEDYNNGNNIFLQKILNYIKSEPHFIHISSYMIYGFKNKNMFNFTPKCYAATMTNWPARG